MIELFYMDVHIGRSSHYLKNAYANNCTLTTYAILHPC